MKPIGYKAVSGFNFVSSIKSQHFLWALSDKTNKVSETIILLTWKKCKLKLDIFPGFGKINEYWFFPPSVV